MSTIDDDIACALPRLVYSISDPLLFSNGQIGTLEPPLGFNAYIWNNFITSNPENSITEFEGNKDEYELDLEQERFGFGGNDIGTESHYICGRTTSSVIPGVNEPEPIFQRTNAGARDGFITKIGCSFRIPVLKTTDSTICAVNDSVTLTLQPKARSVVWDDGTQDSTRVVRAPGIYKATFTVPGGCSYTDSIEITSGLRPSGLLSISDTVAYCDTSELVVQVRGENFTSVQWSAGTVINETTAKVTGPGKYTATLRSADGCEFTTDTLTVVSSVLQAGTRVILEHAIADSASVGSIIRVLIRLTNYSGNMLELLPNTWKATLKFNKSILFPVRPLTLGKTDDSTRIIQIGGRRTTTSDTLGWFELFVALGETDSVQITLDSLVFEPCSEVVGSASIGFHVAGICDANGLRRFISSRISPIKLTVYSNPVGSAGGIAQAFGSDLTSAMAFLVTTLGQEIKLNELSLLSDSAQWSIPAWLSSGKYTLVVRTMFEVESTIIEVVR